MKISDLCIIFETEKEMKIQNFMRRFSRFLVIFYRALTLNFSTKLYLIYHMFDWEITNFHENCNLYMHQGYWCKDPLESFILDEGSENPPHRNLWIRNRTGHALKTTKGKANGVNLRITLYIQHKLISIYLFLKGHDLMA